MVLHNIERTNQNASPLESHIDLEIYAQNHAEWMAKSRRLKHSDLRGDFARMGENIAMGQRSEQEVTKGWMQSPGHRRNILNKGYEYAGFGHAVSEDGTNYWCAVFGGTQL